MFRLNVLEDEAMASMSLPRFKHLSGKEAREAVPRRLNLPRRDGLAREPTKRVSGVFEEAEGRRCRVGGRRV